MTTPERRDQRRVPLDAGYTVSFRVHETDFDGLPTPNLSGGGLCVMVPADRARHFQKGALLQDLVLQHPDLPKDRLCGEVAYTMGGGHLDALRFIGVGVKFVDLPPTALEALNAFVSDYFQGA
jgi:hypothetical protein